MQLLFIVLNKTECLEDLLTDLYDNGICGATIVDSHGMAQSLTEMDDFQFLGSLRFILNPEHKQNKTIFMALKDEQVGVVSRIVNGVTGGLNNPDTGVMFAVPISYAEGLEHAL
jgi:hypothetical protein